MKNLIALALATMFAITFPPHPKTVDFQMNQLCLDHPEKNCTEIVEYCREALETGNECYIIN